MKAGGFGSTGREVSILGQGSWLIDEVGRRQAVAALQAGLDAGMMHVDTAEMYGAGAAESVVGEAIRGRRDEVFLVSKVLPSNAGYKQTLRSCERSLKVLGTDHLDGYLLHWRGSVPLAETFRAFEDLQAAGKILSFGVSNFDVDDLQEACALLEPGKRACNQVLYHLRERAIEHAVMPWCQQHGVAVVGYSPFGHDDFPQPETAQGQLLQQVADAHDATPRQVALAFVTRGEGCFSIPKASSAAHARENAAAAGIDLTAAQLAQLDAAFPRGPRPDWLPML